MTAETIAAAAVRSRGTSNSNERGSSYSRRQRKHWLLVTYQSDEGPGTARCYFCGDLLDWWTLTVDRILPGCMGGTYRRENIRPACGQHNSETGGALARAHIHQAAKKRAAKKKAAVKKPVRRLKAVS